MNQESLKLEATKNGMFSFPWTISLPIKSLPKNPVIVVASLSVQQLHLILGLAYSLLRFSSCLPTPLANFVHACRKLVLYPNRNKSKSEEENICPYLAMTDISSLPLGWEVYVVFLLVLLVQNKGKNLIVQGCYFHNLVTSQYCFVKHVHLICYSVLSGPDALGKGRWFNQLKLEWGFGQFIPHKAINNSCNGILVEDTGLEQRPLLIKKEARAN